MTGSDGSAASSDPRPHVLVQVLSGSEWVDLDPTLADAQPGEALADAIATDAEIQASDRHTMLLEVITETLTGGQLERGTVLDLELEAADASTSEIFLCFQPAIGGIGGSIAQALGEAAAFFPASMVDGEVTQGSTFPVTAATDIFGGAELEGSPDQPALASLMLLVTRKAPGYADKTFVRTFIDRVPTGLRAAGADGRRPPGRHCGRWLRRDDALAGGPRDPTGCVSSLRPKIT